MLQTKIAGGIVVNQAGEIIIVKQKENSWSLPKGHLKAGEDLLTAAKREIYEESGVNTLELIQEIGSYQRYSTDKSELKTIVLFLFKTSQEILHPKFSDTSEAKWLKKEEVLKLLPHKEDKEFFSKAVKTLNL